jgi:uncharacterized membrane protein YeiH
MDETISLPDWLVYVSVTFGGMTGAMHGARKNMDVFGTLIVAVIAAVGAGTIRDLSIGRVPIWLYSPLAGYAILGGIAGYFLARAMRYINRTIFLLDTLLIGVWVVLGAELALLFGLAPQSAILLGVITAVGGGVVRDVVCRDIPTAFNPAQFETVGAVIAATVFVLADSAFPRTYAEALAIITATTIRALALRYRWRSISAVELSERLRGRKSHYDPSTGTLTVMRVAPRGK